MSFSLERIIQLRKNFNDNWLMIFMNCICPNNAPYVTLFKMAYTAGPIFEKKYEAVPHIFCTNN